MPDRETDAGAVSVGSSGEVRVLRTTLTRPSAMPSGYPLGDIAHQAGGTFERAAQIIRIGGRQLSRHAFFLLVNLLVAGLVMSLPFLSSAASHADGNSRFAPSPIGSTSLAPVDGEPTVARASTQSRGGTIAAGRTPVTILSEGVRPIEHYTLSTDDTLSSIGNFYGLSAEAIAFANGITDPYHLQLGREIMI